MIEGVKLTPFNAAAILIVLAAVPGYLNYRFLKLPSSIGLTVMGAVASSFVVPLLLAVGGTAFRMMRAIDDHKVEVLISLAGVMGGYAIARPLHASGPVAMAVAGLIIGNAGVAHAISVVVQGGTIKRVLERLTAADARDEA